MKNNVVRKIQLGALVVLVVSCMLVIFPGGTPKFLSGEDEVKPGQVWRYSTNPKNPFEKPLVDTTTVLAVKDGYVLYTSTLTGGKRESATIRMFLIGSTRIK